MDERAREIGEAEALLRDVNEEIARLREEFGIDAATVSVVCECGDPDCVERIDVPVAVRDAVREDGARFLVRPGHVAEDVEHVVERADAYWVIEKDPGEPAELAEARS